MAKEPPILQPIALGACLMKIARLYCTQRHADKARWTLLLEGQLGQLGWEVVYHITLNVNTECFVCRGSGTSCSQHPSLLPREYYLQITSL